MRQSDAREVPLVERRRESVRLEFTFEGIFFIIQRISLLNPKCSSFYHQEKERVVFTFLAHFAFSLFQMMGWLESNRFTNGTELKKEKFLYEFCVRAMKLWV